MVIMIIGNYKMIICDYFIMTCKFSIYKCRSRSTFFCLFVIIYDYLWCSMYKCRYWATFFREIFRKINPNTVLELFETPTKLIFKRFFNNQMKAKSRQYQFLLSRYEKASINIDIVKNRRVGMLATHYLGFVIKICVKGPDCRGAKFR